MAAADGIFAQWMQLFGEAISAMAGQAAVVSPAPDRGGDAGLVWLAQRLSVDTEPSLWIGSAAADSAEIGKAALAGAGLEDPTAKDIEGTFRELAGQAISGLAQAIGRLLKKEVTCAGSLEDAPAPQLPFGFQVQVAGVVIGPLRIGFSASLLALVEAAMAPAPAEPVRPAGPTLPDGRSNSIELLLDVELPVRVSFGKAQLLLRDVIKLTTGSIVELNRAVTEPVEVLVNNCVIARGEVVVVDGNYGVRIHQIISRQERLRSVN